MQDDDEIEVHLQQVCCSILEGIGDLWFSYYVGGWRPVDDRELTFVVPR